MNADAEDTHATLLSVASSISDRRSVDWDTAELEVGPQLSGVLDELRILEGVARLGEDVPTTWGDFDIIDELGRGAFGTVYTAHDPTLRLNVALKVIRPVHPTVPFDAEKAFDEARRLAKINHANVVRVFRADRRGDEVGVSMELVDGQTLEALVRQRGPLTVREVTSIGIDLCRALSAVHDADTLHGDVKAHNVMRSRDGRIVLMDFGTGRDLSMTRRAGEDLAGTPLYLAPEVFAGAVRSRASDVYSLGVLLYYLASGTYPVEGSTLTEVRRGHIAPGPRRSLDAVRPDLPAAFVRVVEKAIAPEPKDRFASTHEFEAALAQLVGTPDRWRWVKIGGAIAVVAALLTALGASLSNASRESGVGGVAALSAGQYRVDAAIYREENGVDVRLQPGARVARGDKLSLHFQASVPAHVYVVNEDEMGESFLLYPLPGQDASVPLPAGVQHRLPGMRDDQRVSWEITSSGQREHFLIFVRPDRSEAFERLFARLPAPSAERRAATPLDASGVGVLRGVGGLAATTVKADQGLRNTPEFATPLPSEAETTAGVWVRQVAFENPSVE